MFEKRWQRQFLEAWRVTLEETRAWANFELVEILHQFEEQEWVRYSRLRQRAEQPSKDPVDGSFPTGRRKSRKERRP